MPGKYDPRNKLNDLTGKEWLKLTKSFWMSQKTADDKFAFNHPAPFLISDIEKLISMFTKSNMTVLDPFSGVGTSLVAARNLNRKAVGVELNQEYCRLAEERMTQLGHFDGYSVIQGDSNVVLDQLDAGFDYCVTSPPYHNILQNKSQGIRTEKDNYRTGPRIGTDYYSDLEVDLGNQKTYEDFLNLFFSIMGKVFLKLRDKAYVSIVISDFTVAKKEVNVQGDIVRGMQDLGFEFVGTIALLQDNKPLYPFGYPYAYKINHHHQNIINFRKQTLDFNMVS